MPCAPINYPPHWLPGQLLDLKRYIDGSYRATLLGDNDDPKQDYIAPSVHFESSREAQAFTSWWYQPAAAREAHGQAQ
jgi:hypothetical protein